MIWRGKGSRGGDVELELTFPLLPTFAFVCLPFRSTGLELPIMYDTLLNRYGNFFLRQRIEQVLKFKPPEARTLFIQKAEAYRVSKLAPIVKSVTTSY